MMKKLKRLIIGPSQCGFDSGVVRSIPAGAAAQVWPCNELMCPHCESGWSPE